MTRKPVLLLLGGDLPDPALVRRAARASRLLVCADGGLRHAARLGLPARFVVGDMDSLPRPLPRRKETTYWCDFDQGRSDFEKALAFLDEIGCPDAFVAGALGGRLDHAVVNLALAERASAARRHVLLDRGTAEVLGPGRRRLALRAGAPFSVCALAPGAVVSISGARYPLKRFRLLPGSRGLSNAAAKRPVLTVHSGRVWLAAPSGLL